MPERHRSNQFETRQMTVQRQLSDLCTDTDYRGWYGGGHFMPTSHNSQYKLGSTNIDWSLNYLFYNWFISSVTYNKICNKNSQSFQFRDVLKFLHAHQPYFAWVSAFVRMPFERLSASSISFDFMSKYREPIWCFLLCNLDGFPFADGAGCSQGRNHG